MVHSYKRKSTRGSWNLRQMELAIQSVRNGEQSVREASATFGVPKSTLDRHKNKKVLVPGCLGRHQLTLDADFVAALVSIH